MKFTFQVIVLLLFFAITLTGCKNSNQKNREYSVQTDIKFSQTVNSDTLDNTKIGWGIKKNENAPPDVPSDVKEMLKKYNGYYLGDTEKKVVYLTFDEGYENGYTADILDTLKKNNVKAAFFITGDYAEREPELVRRMVKEGHIIGNHTMNHPSLPEISLSEYESELKELDELVYKLCKAKVEYVRPPKGEYSEKTLAVLSEMGYKTVFWSFAYVDWDVTVSRGGDYAFNQIYPYLDEGEVLLLHAVSADNAECLDRFIRTAAEEGYKFGTLDELTK